MTAISSFPLFNLPLVAIHDVLIKTMPIELIQLCSVSKKTKTIVNSFIKRNSSKMNYDLVVTLDSDCGRVKIDLWHGGNEKLKINFRSIGYGYSCKKPMILRKFNNVNVHVNVKHDDNIFYVYCEDIKITSRNMLQYFCQMFNPIITVDSFGNESLTSEVLDVLKVENAKLDGLILTTIDATDHFYQMLLELPIRKLNIWPPPSDSFQYKLSNKPMKFNELDLFHAQWVKHLEQFLQCKNVNLMRTNLKNQDVNRFLKKWMVTDCQLEFLHFYMDVEQPNITEIIKRLPVEPLNRVFINNHFLHFKDGKCFRIQQSNGKKALIYQSASAIILRNE